MRQRQPLKLTKYGQFWVTKYRRKNDGAVIRLKLAPLSQYDAAREVLDLVNAYNMHEELSDKLPLGLRAQLTGERLRQYTSGGETFPESAIPSDLECHVREAIGDAVYSALEDSLTQPLLRLLDDRDRHIKELEREIGVWRGRKLRKGPAPTLKQAVSRFVENYKGRDRGHEKNVRSDLDRFVADWGPDRKIDFFEGKEKELDAWLRDLKNTQKGKDGKLLRPDQPLGASRKRNIRMYVLKLLRENEVDVNAKAVCPIGEKDLQRERGGIRWLEEEIAKKLADALPERWRDIFVFQLCTGLRPSELITLQRENFSNDFSTLTLARRGTFTLKTGSRTIKVPAEAQRIVEKRLEKGDVLFPPLGVDEHGKQTDWKDEANFLHLYRKNLIRAKEALGPLIPFKIDCRIARRTCASILLRHGVDYVAVAELLGDRPETIRKHYARLLPGEVDPSPVSDAVFSAAKREERQESVLRGTGARDKKANAKSA